MSSTITPFTIEFSLQEQDYLDFQLYQATKSERIIKRRKRNKITVPLFYGAVAVYFSVQGNLIGSVLFLLMGAGWFLYYAKWEGGRYVRHYKKYVKETFKTLVNTKIVISFNDEFVFATQEGIESRIQNSEIDSLIEIPTLILLKLRTGEAFILPKNRLIDKTDTIARLKEFAAGINIPYKVENDWVWK